jgi:DNA-binding Lrp family transcriptional regulator
VASRNGLSGRYSGLVTPLRAVNPQDDLPDWRGIKLDELDRRIIVALQTNGRASWKGIAQALGASEPTVARRGRRLIDRNLVRVVGYIDVMRAGLGIPALVRINCDPRERERLAGVIRRRDDVRVASMLTGPTDIFAEFVVPSPEALVHVLNQDLPNIHGIVGTETLAVMHSFYSVNPWERSLLTQQEREELADPTQPRTERLWEAPVALDAVDLAIMAELAEDGRRPAKAIAAAIGSASESTVARRIDRLVAEGCVYFRVIAPPAMLGFSTEVVIWLRVASAHLDEAAHQLVEHPAIKFLWVTAGRFNLCAAVHLRHLGELYSLETEVLGPLPLTGTMEVSTHLSTFKRAWLELYPSSVPGPAEAAGRAVRALIEATSENQPPT